MLAFACFCLLLLAFACSGLLLLAFACLLAFAHAFAVDFAIAKAEASKAKFDSQARRIGESQHDGGIAPKCPESNLKQNLKPGLGGGNGGMGGATHSTLLLIVYSVRTLLS